MNRVEVTTNKAIRPDQLKEELGGKDVFTGEGVVQAEGCTKAALQSAIDAHVPDPDWLPAGPERDWKLTLRDEVAFIENQLASWPTNAISTGDALLRVNFLLAASKRLARNQQRILRFIDDHTKDSDD